MWETPAPNHDKYYQDKVIIHKNSFFNNSCHWDSLQKSLSYALSLLLRPQKYYVSFQLSLHTSLNFHSSLNTVATQNLICCSLIVMQLQFNLLSFWI